MGKVIAVANQKGGVGKTTTVVNLGIGMVMHRKKVLVIDADPQGSLTLSLGITDPDSLDHTISTIMGKIINDIPIDDGEAIIYTEEGVDLLPANIELSGLEISLVNVMSREAAARSISIIDLATDHVSMQMAKLGASQNRLEHHINSLTKEMEALTDANSNIRDTDYAKELLEYTRMRILMESNSAMLAQSNAIQQQSILSLMR